MESRNTNLIVEEMIRDIRSNCKSFFLLFTVGLSLLISSVPFALCSWQYGRLVNAVMFTAGVCICTLAIMTAIIIFRRLECVSCLLTEFRN